MKTADRTPLTEEQRQSPIAILIIVQTLFITVIKSAWPVFVFYFISPQSKFEYFLTIIGIGAVAISTVGSLIAYFNFYFHLRENEMVMRAGLFNKTNRNIPFDRIQTVNFTQTIIHRIFNVVQLDLDTAGSAGNELAIKALTKTKANEIRNFILQRKALLGQEDVTALYADEQTTETTETPKKELLRLSVIDLLKIGVSQNHLRTAGIITVFLIGLSEYAEPFLGKEKENEVWTAIFGSMIIVSVLLLLIILAAFLLTLIKTVFHFYDLRVTQTESGFNIIAGLFTRREQSALVKKIQLVVWHSNPVKRIFGLYTLYLKQAASKLLVGKKTFHIPGCYQDQIDTIRESYFPDFNPDDFTSHAISPLIINRYTRYFGIIPVLILIGIYIWKSWLILLVLFWIPVVYFYARSWHARWRYALSYRGIYYSKGFLGQRAAILRWEKVQAITLNQSPFQQRRELASISFSTAGGTLELPYITLKQANRLQDFVLWKIETHKKSWM